MIRNAKVLGLALVAMLAMSSMVASAASATTFDAPGAKTSSIKVTAGQEAKFEHSFTVTAGAVTCENATFSGEAKPDESKEKDVEKIDSVEILPVYTGCLFAGNTATVNMNGCKYKLYATGLADILCPGTEITVTAPTLGTTKCTIHVPQQLGLKTASYTNLGSSPTKEVTLNANITGIKYTQTEGSGLGKCANASDTNGTYVGKALVTGENAAGTAHTDIIWTA